MLFPLFMKNLFIIGIFVMAAALGEKRVVVNLLQMALPIDPWEPLVQYADVWKRLVVLEQDVILRLILFDEVVFQQQRIELGVGDREVDVGNFGNELQGLAIDARVLGKVTGNAFADVLRLADVDECLFVV